MSFTPDSSQEIAPFKLVQASISEANPMYWPLVVLATPSVVLTILGMAVPSLENMLTIVEVFIVAPVISGASIYLTYRYLSTQTLDFAGSLTEATGKSIQLILGFLLYAIAVLVGLVFLIVPGIYLAIRLGFALYAIVLDDLDAIAALKSSWNLVGGRCGTVFIAYFVSSMCFSIPVLLISALIGVALGLGGEMILNIFSVLMGLFAIPLIAIYTTKLYQCLKASNVS